MFLTADTICALSTPPGIGGLAVLRLCGPKAWEIALKLSNLDSQAQVAPETVHFARLKYHGEIIDETIFTFFKGPRSFTGEDIVEITCHGGRYAAARILDILLENGARMARPGEFTERAFLNGKMDLAQAEAVAGLIHARTHRAGRAAVRQLEGGLSNKVHVMRSRLLDMLSLLELELDFSEEDVIFLQPFERDQSLAELQKELHNLAATFQRGRLVREGIRLAIVGAPNAGKSTLLNAMLREERAIVSPEPGTTRDVVEARLELEGIELILQDTAGIRQPAGAIEGEGIARTHRTIQGADLVLLIVDAHTPLWPEQDTLDLLSGKHILLVLNKIDLPRTQPAQHPIGLDFIDVAHISAKSTEGVDDLLSSALHHLIGEHSDNDEIIVAEARHHDALLRAEACLARTIGQKLAPTLIASDVRNAVEALGEITGESVGEEILDRIFSKFCIGK
jgi:tRNA modification GTPase